MSVSGNKPRKNNLQKKFMFRELYGEIRKCRSRPLQRLFDQLPHRLAFSLSAISPESALANGHIYLGFTKCGQFILSYTCSSDTDDLTLQINRRYRLHWWLFTPYKRLRKVAEVMLFGDQNLQARFYENVFISICQWPKDLSKILVYGCSMDSVSGIDIGSVPQSRRVYLTVTAVPSLDKCSDCFQVATSYEDEDVAERWNSCVRFSCLKHGVTVHTGFDMVPMYPKFMPKIQLKLGGYVILNAGNFIHVLHVDLENMSKRPRENSSPARIALPESVMSEESEDEDSPNIDSNIGVSLQCSDDKCDKESVIDTSDSPEPTDDTSQSSDGPVCLRRENLDKDREWEILIGNIPKSDPGESTSNCVSQDSSPKSNNEVTGCEINSNTDINCDSINLSNLNLQSQKSNSTKSPISKTSPKISKSNSTDDLISDDSRVFSLNNGNSTADSAAMCCSLNLAEKEYEFIDEITESRYEKLSAFRRRRLADKKYEFSDSDENSENIPLNYRTFRRQSQRLIFSPSRSPRIRPFPMSVSELSVDLDDTQGFIRTVYEKLLSPSSAGTLSPNDILRPINQNISSPVQSPRPDDAKWELHRWSSRESLGLFSPAGCNQRNQDSMQHSRQSSVEPQVLKCVVDIKRRYIEVDDELVSIITDIEDDELVSTTGYHNALPLEVHGSGYSQLQRISNSKAARLMVPTVMVRQLSLDVEQFCHETAQRMCNESGKKYYCCNDYNVEIIDVCPSSRNVVALASVLVQAANPKSVPISKSLRSRVAQYTVPARTLYTGSFTFVFNIDSSNYYVIDKEPLVEDDPFRIDVDSESVASSDSCEEHLWWLNARVRARALRARTAIPMDYYSNIKVMTNEAVMKGKSLSHIMESYHLVAIVMKNESG